VSFFTTSERLRALGIPRQKKKFFTTNRRSSYKAESLVSSVLSDIDLSFEENLNLEDLNLDNVEETEWFEKKSVEKTERMSDDSDIGEDTEWFEKESVTNTEKSSVTTKMELVNNVENFNEGKTFEGVGSNFYDEKKLFIRDLKLNLKNTNEKLNTLKSIANSNQDLIKKSYDGTSKIKNSNLDSKKNTLNLDKKTKSQLSGKKKKKKLKNQMNLFLFLHLF
ncbi:hypothetical protein HK099_006791, partial [Clydaea vesicula]